MTEQLLATAIHINLDQVDHLLSSTEEAALVAHVKDIAACGYGYTRRELAELAGETALVAHVKDIAACGYGYTRRELAELAGETAFFLNKRDTSAPLHDKWMYDFLKRWPELKIMKPKGLSMVRAHSATRETLDNYYKELLRIIQKYKLLEKPHRIFNVDETGISSEHIPPKIVASRGRTPLAMVSSRSATTTIISTVSAIGQVLPPYIIFKGKRMCDDLLAGALPGTQATMSETGWSNTKIFQMYLNEHFLKYVPTNKDEPLLLLYDEHSSHVNVPLIEWAQKHNIILFLLPAHTSHLLQPLDVGVFGPFKVSYYNECRNYLRKHPGQIITRYDVCCLTANALSHTMIPGNIIGSFKRTGIYPFNASVVTDEQLAPSTSVNPPKQHSHIDQCEQNTNVNPTVHSTGDQCEMNTNVKPTVHGTGEQYTNVTPTVHGTDDQYEPNTTANSSTAPQQNHTTLANFLHAKIKRFMPPYKHTRIKQSLEGNQ